MRVDLEKLGLRLRTYREQLQETLSEVSDATGIPGERLAALESGSIRPSGDEILILADHWACDVEALLAADGGQPINETEILYRRHGRDFSKEDRRVVQEFLFLCEMEASLIRELGRNIRTFSHKPTGSHYKAQGERGALALRRFFEYESGAPRVAMDIYRDFRSIGAHIFRRHLLNSNISGLFISHPTAGACLLVNYDEDVYRQRFSVAHEMAHAIFDQSERAVVSFTSSQQGNFKEYRANRFASCYLIPPSIVKNLPDPARWSETDARHWANRFKVSCTALGIALREARVVSPSVSKRIQGFRVPAEAKVDPELSSDLSVRAAARKRELLARGLSDFYANVCFEAHERGLISIGRLAEALLSDIGDLADIAKLYRRSLRYGD